MGVTVRVPTPLQKLTRDQDRVSAEGSDIREVISDLDRQYPGIRERLYGEDGKIRRFINIFLNDEDIRFLEGETTSVKDGDEISIIPAIAGGARA